MDNTAKSKGGRAFDVFNTLRTSSRILHDDTQVEKFISWVLSVAKSKVGADEFLSNPEVISFFSYAAEHIIEEPYQGLVIALRLGPNLLCTSNAANEVQTLPAGTSSSVTYPSWLEIFNAARRTEPWSEGSVRNAWVLGIDKMCSSQSGLMWCLEKGFLSTVVEILNDDSIFVTKQAQELILKILPKLSCNSENGDSLDKEVFQNFQGVNQEIGHAIRSPLSVTVGTHNPTNVGKSLEMLQGICRNTEFENTEFQRNLLNDDAVVKDLLGLLENQQICQQRRIIFEVVTTLRDLLLVRKRREKISDLDGSLGEWPLHLLRKEQIYSAMMLASSLLNSKICENVSLFREVLLLPLLVITERPFSSISPACLETVCGALDSKAAIIDAILHTLRLIGITECLDLSGVMTELLELLNLSLKAKPVSSTTEGAQDVQLTLKNKMTKIIFNHNKLQLALFDLFIKLNQRGPILDQDSQLAVIQGCLQLLERHGLPPPLSNKAYECILLYIMSLTICGLEEEKRLSLLKTLESLGERIKMGLCDIAWEVRDTAVEIIGKLIQRIPDDTIVSSWLVSESLVEQVWRSIDDGQSYVRAAALTFLTMVPKKPLLWQQLLKDCSEVEILDKVSSIVKDDTEAFARRAAVQLLCEWSAASILTDHRSAILTTINTAITDLDWEVKTTILNYWSSVLENISIEIPEYAINNVNQCDGNENFQRDLQKINSDGGLKCVLFGLTDYDQCVQCKACKILIKLRRNCIRHGLCVDSNDEPKMKKARLEKASTLESRGLGELLHITDKSMDWKNGLTIDMLIKILDSVDLDAVMIEVSESTDDYIRNPESLFDDILTSLANDEDDQDNAIDCY